MSSERTSRLRLYVDEGPEEADGTSLIDDQAKTPDELLERCNTITRRVHPARLVDSLKKCDVPNDYALKKLRSLYYHTYMALLRAARQVLGADFRSTHFQEHSNQFVYERALDTAGISTAVEDVEHLIEEIVDLEELVESVHVACLAVIPPDGPDPPRILHFRAA
ncbi:MAG: hypothetical protein G01um101425_901 [Candidatus Peregrinibacteria bacterium Gr01-1014_25]|nr:MAG: hypothetical protein G01um101425_901 [Candidatus Peregrinibacteria bacterium Gr01-1014_25]